MHLYEDQFSENHDFPKVERPSKVLIIASTARSGSHMLGHALYKTNKFGFPLEYVNSANLAEWKRRLKIDDIYEVLSEIQRRRTSPNGVFAIKIHYDHIKQFGGFDNLVKRFPNAYFVVLSRNDVLKQSISLSIASQTGVWISGQKPMNDNPKYDFSYIDKCLRKTILDNASWRYSLAASGCNYIEMDFDQVRHNLVQSIKNIANFIEIELAESEIPNDHVTKKQSNDINVEWSEMFISEFNLSNELLSNLRPSIVQKIKRKIKRIFST